MQKQNKKKAIRPAQQQNSQPGIESKMKPLPEFYNDTYRPSGKLAGKFALITGGDSGIGRAVAAHFASEGADVAIIYLNETSDAQEAADFIETNFNRQCLRIRCDIRDEKKCNKAVKEVLKKFGSINILVNNAAIHFPQEMITDISAKQLKTTFETNVYSMFYLIKAIVPQMREDDVIINTSSVTAYRGSGHLIDYSASKGAIISLTRSLAGSLADKKIRVNAVAPGPVWTPLIPASFKRNEVQKFGSDVPLKRAGEPEKLLQHLFFLPQGILHLSPGKLFIQMVVRL